MEFSKSETKINLMRAFAGESQARNRYNMASSQAKKDGYNIVSSLFDYIACQEQAHGTVFYEHLKQVNDENFTIDASYPVNVYSNTLDLLKAAKHNEMEEHDNIYKSFGEIAKDEGFPEIASSFEMIAKIEKIHAEKFGALINHIEKDTLFKRDSQIAWYCTNCGHIHTGPSAPQVCPVCKHARGYFLSEDLNKQF